MAENAFGDFFLGDSDEDQLDGAEVVVGPPVVVPASPEPVVAAPPVAAPAPAYEDLPVPVPAPAPEQVASPARTPSREERLAGALNRLMHDSQEIQAAALVSLDGFTMASALPEGMQEDRVGAMSAAILGLGERAAAELGRGQLTQVFIEGDGGYVMLIAAGDRAVLTCLADIDAKLGLVLYDMREAAGSISQILG